MMTPPTTCADCGGPMEPGYVLDHGHTNYRMRARWVNGEPEKGFWSGLRTRGRRVLGIRAFRCTRCGLLKQYALDGDVPR